MTAETVAMWAQSLGWGLGGALAVGLVLAGVERVKGWIG